MDDANTQRTPVPTAGVIRALSMPEVVQCISVYLDAADLISCFSVSRYFRSSFGPFVWHDLHFGAPCKINYHETPLARRITLRSPKSPGTLERAAQWTRSLSINSHETFVPLQLGQLCRGLERIHLEGLWCAADTWKRLSGMFFDDAGDEELEDEEEHMDVSEYWKSCERMIRGNQGRLKSLSLVNWFFTSDLREDTDQPQWNPLVGSLHCSSLRSLKLKDCEIQGPYMTYFWNVSQHVESLELDDVKLDLEYIQGSTVESGPIGAQIQGTTSYAALPETRLPRLNELALRNVHGPTRNYADQVLKLLVATFPALRTLSWTADRGPYEYNEFVRLFCAGTWPKLDSIVVNGTMNPISEECYSLLLTDPDRHPHHRPIRRLEVTREMTTATPFNLYTHHFSVLESIDICCDNDYSSDWSIQILKSCPSLQRFRSRVIKAQEIIDSGPAWVCHGLQEFSILIDMGLHQDSLQPYEFSEHELDQSRAVYKQLATLRRLRILDLLIQEKTGRWFGQYSGVRRGLIPPPMTLEAGLDELSRLTALEKVSFWGRGSALSMEEVTWMLNHWKRLVELTGYWVLFSPCTRGWGGYHMEDWQAVLNSRGVHSYRSEWEHAVDCSC